jgi:hypothetical protein
MKRDAQLEYSVAQAVTASAASTNYIDLGTAGDAIEGGATCYLVIRVGTAATASGAATVTFDLRTDSDPAFGTETTLFSSGALAKTALTANTWIVRIALPIGMKQYSRVYYTVATGPLTAGTFDAFITDALDTRR